MNKNKLRDWINDHELVVREISEKVRDVKEQIIRIEESVEGISIPLTSDNDFVNDRFEIEVACKSLNQVHGEDAYQFINSNLKGIVIGDGISNANGGLASRLVTSIFKQSFKGFVPPVGIEDTVDHSLDSALETLKNYVHQKEMTGSATTLILVLTDGLNIYIFYSGDGYIYHFRGDLGSYGSYMVAHNYGSALAGYIGYVDGKKYRVYNSMKVRALDNGSFIIIATDGAELDREQDGGLVNFYKRLTKVKEGEMSLEEAIDSYLNELKGTALKDDATIGVIWLKHHEG